MTQSIGFGQMPDSCAVPVVSVVMANFRGAAHLACAMASVLAQTERRLELIVVDDASDDDSVEIARGIARDDARVRVIASANNQGPAATRNLALEAARGTWVAIVDSDDLIHPARLARLIAAAEAAGADLIADDLVYFGAGTAPQGQTLLQAMALVAPMPLSVALYLQGNGGGASVPHFGYLKPVFRRAALAGRRYDPRLRIGEDYDLVLRLMIDGRRFTLLPDPLYAYRRHAGSISHRLSIATVEAMLQAHRALPPLAEPEARAAAAAVDGQLSRALRYERLVAAIKARSWRSALPRLADPAMLSRLLESLRDRRRRSRGMAPAPEVAALPAALPDLPVPGADWSQPPAPLAARIATLGPRGAALPPSSPDWAVWLARATG